MGGIRCRSEPENAKSVSDSTNGREGGLVLLMYSSGSNNLEGMVGMFPFVRCRTKSRFIVYVSINELPVGETIRTSLFC